MKCINQAILLFVLFMVGASNAYPCSCADESQRKKFRRASVVFLGEIIEVSYNQDDYFINAVKFKVERQWKGTKRENLTVLVGFDAPGSCNDMPLDKGKRYLIYAYCEKGKLITFADCGPNIKAEGAAAETKSLDRFWFRFTSRLFPF
ncbi:MAG TPA: hypothetical protein VNO70_24850 [Blastocatellia bacterium]|nr:hypothetical protein [Blastocatellia bacterium]